MPKINIILRKTPGKDEWSVIWDEAVVYRASGPAAEFCAGAFVDGLERGLTGSKQPLDANSQVKIEGVIYSFDEMDFD